MVRMKTKSAKKSSLGMSVLEVVFAVGITLIVTPFAYRLAFSELSEVKFLNAAKQIKSIRQALLNYLIVHSKAMSNSEGNLPETANSADIKTKLGTYGVEDTGWPILNGIKGRYFKSSDGEIRACVSLDMDGFGFDDAGVRQALMYVGDAAGYKEDNTIISVTGAWTLTDAMATPLTPAGVQRVAAVCIDNETLETANVSGVYLYRNEKGGADGNKMGAELLLGGNSIKNFNTADVKKLENVPELKFIDGSINPGFTVNKSLILNGMLKFAGGSVVTPLLLVENMLQIASIKADGAKLVKRESGSGQTSSLRATLYVENEAIIPKLRVQDLVVNDASSPGMATNGLSIFGFNPSAGGIPNSTPTAVDSNNKLELKIKNLSLCDTGGCATDAQLQAKFISVRDGYIRGENDTFTTQNGNMNVSSSFRVYIYNMGQKYNEASGVDGFDLNGPWVGNFIGTGSTDGAIKGLDTLIDAMTP